jgi:hypothetical protein
MRSLVKRCETLERWAKELRRPEEEAQQLHDKQVQDVTQLFGAFPEERHEELLELLFSDRWAGSGLASLLNLIERGFWSPVPIPPAAADIFFAELDVQPNASCDSCKAMLPYRMGMWTNAETGKAWQGPLCYFRRCPCGGTILNSAGRPIDLHPWAARARGAALDIPGRPGALEADCRQSVSGGAP